jgi:hypothetical protein
VSEQERGREGAERARAHLARAQSELEAAQRFVEPRGGGDADLALARALANARASLPEAMETVRMTLTMDRSSRGAHFYSPEECVEGVFSEVRHDGALGSSHSPGPMPSGVLMYRQA